MDCKSVPARWWNWVPLSRVSDGGFPTLGRMPREELGKDRDDIYTWIYTGHEDALRYQAYILEMTVYPEGCQSQEKSKWSGFERADAVVRSFTTRKFQHNPGHASLWRLSVFFFWVCAGRVTCLSDWMLRLLVEAWAGFFGQSWWLSSSTTKRQSLLSDGTWHSCGVSFLSFPEFWRKDVGGLLLFRIWALAWVELELLFCVLLAWK